MTSARVEAIDIACVSCREIPDCFTRCADKDITALAAIDQFDAGTGVETGKPNTIVALATEQRIATITTEQSIKTACGTRDPENIMVEMDFFSRKKLGDTLISMARCRVYDDQEGLFTARLKGMLR